MPPGVIVAPAWLEGHLGEDVCVVDLRDAEAYAEGHVPGAVHLELAALGASEPGRDNVLLGPDAFTRLMEGLGVRSGASVVAYDDQWGLAAARLVWALHFYGHRAVAALDGGWDRWQEEGRPVSEAAAPRRQGRFSAVPTPEVAATHDWIAARLHDEETALLDTRTRQEFEAGHIPGAAWWDWFTAVPPGSWDAARAVDELRSEWEALGAATDREVVVYCRTGMRAAHTYMALKHAGYPRVRLYDGSWQEWSMIEGEGERE